MSDRARFLSAPGDFSFGTSASAREAVREVLRLREDLEAGRISGPEYDKACAALAAKAAARRAAAPARK